MLSVRCLLESKKWFQITMGYMNLQFRGEVRAGDMSQGSAAGVFAEEG